MWFIWPAVSDDFKISIGMLPDPEAEAASSSADASASSKAPAVAPAVELSEEAQEKVENAYKSHDQIVEEKMSDEEKAVLKAVEKGDFGALDNDWDEFMTKAIKPGEDDDDDDDDVSQLRKCFGFDMSWRKSVVGRYVIVSFWVGMLRICCEFSDPGVCSAGYVFICRSRKEWWN